MTKTEAVNILAAIHQRDTEGYTVEQGLQLAVNSYIDDLVQHNPNLKLSNLQWDFDKKSNNLIKSFQQALRNKIKTINKKSTTSEIINVVKQEDRIILSEVCSMLEMTQQNLNHLLRTHTEINVITISPRKRYMVKSEIEKLKKIGKK